MVTKVRRYDDGIALSNANPTSLDALELIGVLSRLVRDSLGRQGFHRLEDLRGFSERDLLKMPNIGRRSATILLGLVADYEAHGRLTSLRFEEDAADLIAHKGAH